MSLQPGPEDPSAESSLTPEEPEAAPDRAGQEPAAAPQWPDGAGDSAPTVPDEVPPAPAWGSSPAAPAAPPASPEAPWTSAAGGTTPGWDSAPPSPQGPGMPPYGAPAPYGAPPAWGAPPPPAPGFASGPGAPPPAPGGYYPAGGPGYGSAYPYGQPYPVQTQTDSKATIGLVLAIVSWLLCPIVLAIAALIVAGQSNRAIDASGGRLEGRSLNTATKWIAWINIVLYGLALVASLIFLGWLATQPDLIDQITDSSTQF